MRKKEPVSTPPSPPSLASAWLAHFCKPALLDEVAGDLEELYALRCRQYGRWRAQLEYWWDVLWFLRPYVLRRGSTYDQAKGPIMWKNYLKIALRTLRKHKGTSLINISGLSIGMACCLVILLFVREEVSYDGYHENRNDLYRVSITSVVLSSGAEFDGATSPILWGPTLKRDYPEVIDYARFVNLVDPASPWRFQYQENEFLEQDLLFADASALDLFTWPLLQGDPTTALNEPTSIVLTEDMAEKYFGAGDPLGQALTLDPQLRDDAGALTGQTFEFTVTGVLKNIPRRSHFTFDFLLPIAYLNNVYGGDVTSGDGMNEWFWRGRVSYTYLHLQKSADLPAFEAKFADFQDRYLGDMTRSRGYYYVPFLQRIDEIYLGGNRGNQLQPVGNLTNLYLFSTIALFILIIASINFMNLSTARSAGRAKEVGLRKVVGAHRKQLVVQFLSESVLTSLVAFVLAVGLAWLILPVFYGYLNKTFVLEPSGDLFFLLGLLGVGLLVGIFAGSYPAFFLSRFKPVVVLKGLFMGPAQGSRLRKGLVVFQFALSAFLIIATLTVFKQLDFMRDHELGFDQEQVLVIPPSLARSLMPSYEAFKEELLRHPEIADVTAASGVPSQGGGGDIYVAEGSSAEEGFGLGEVMVDYNYMDLLGMTLVAGRSFSRDIVTDAGLRNEEGRPLEVTAVINEEAVRRFGWASPEEALGKRIIRDPQAGDWTANIIGVVRDFHFQSLQQPIGPAALILLPSYSYLAVKAQPGMTTEAVGVVERTAQTFAPEVPFAYSFLDASFAEQYEAEERLSEVFSYVSFLAIFIACLGLFSLAAFSAEQRTKEIGVRKVLGASVGNIMVLFSKGFLILIVLAFTIAVPAAYFTLQMWLEDFAYRTTVGVGTIALAGLLALVIAAAAVGYQALRAALTNPAESLRYE